MAKLEDIPDGLRKLRLIPSVAEAGSYEIPFDATINVDATGIGFAEDSAATSTDVGIPALAVRRDTASSGVDTDGDYAMLSVDSAGRLRVLADALPSAYTNNVASADTAAHAFGSRTVKTPVTIVLNGTTTGTVTITDATNGGVVLDVLNRSAVFYCANLNELKYTFGTHAGTEKFGISCGI